MSFVTNEVLDCPSMNKPSLGIEPRTFRLQVWRSATKLRRPVEEVSVASFWKPCMHNWNIWFACFIAKTKDIQGQACGCGRNPLRSHDENSGFAKCKLSKNVCASAQGFRLAYWIWNAVEMQTQVPLDSSHHMIGMCSRRKSSEGTPGFEPGTCWSAVSRSNHWAMYPMHCLIVITVFDSIRSF